MLTTDTDWTGKISKQAHGAFLDAKIDRLDADKSGEAEAKELTRSRFRGSRFAQMG